jgi:hypothetical protein
MSSPRQLFVAFAVCAFALEGCAARSVHSYLERGADLGRYQRYTWGSADPFGTGDPRLDNNEIVQERIQAAIEKQLAARGFQKIASGSPEMLVHYHVSVEQRIDLTDKEPTVPCPECKPFIYDAGTLVVDLVDAGSNRVVWRGWSEGNVDGLVDNQRWLDEQLDETVTRIFEQLPRRAR